MEVKDLKIPPDLSHVEKSKLVKMDDDTSKFFIGLSFMELKKAMLLSEFLEKRKTDKGLKELTKAGYWDDGIHMIQGTLLFKILTSRIPKDAEVNISVVLFITLLCDRPGPSVLWAWTLFNLWLKHRKPVDMFILAEEFPSGFPGDEEIERIWEAQKGHQQDPQPEEFIDNLLDLPYVWDKARERSQLRN